MTPRTNPRSRPRLLHVTTTDMSLDWLLGAQLRAFAAAGYEVMGVSARTDPAHADALVAAGIEHVPLVHATRSVNPREDLAALRELHGVFRRLRPDIVHTHNPKPGVYGRLAARAAGVPVIVNTVHGLYAVPEDPWRKRLAVYGLERLAGLAAQAELLQNPEDLETLAGLGVPRRKLVLLGNGIDLDRFDPAAVDPSVRDRLRASVGAGPDDIVVGLVGRLVWEKGYREVFAAATQLRRRLPHLRFVVIGPDDGAKADAVTAADQADATHHGGVTFLGSRTDVHDWYAAMDLYVLASHREGFPRSAMEAAAMGLPVVTTDVRGCRQVVVHDETGVLIPVRDPVALAEAVSHLATRPDARARLGAAARALAVREFDQQRVIDITLATYERLRASASSA